jgi:hypothetical protein
MTPIKAWGVVAYNGVALAHGWDVGGQLDALVYRTRAEARRARVGRTIIRVEIRELPATRQPRAPRGTR